MKYNVEVVRVAYGFRTIEVQADNEHDAQEKALEVAGNYEYSEKTSDYTVEFVEPVNETTEQFYDRQIQKGIDAGKEF